MMEATKGPWEVDFDHRKDGADQIVELKYGFTICFMATGFKKERSIANARLIASAPDLLVALTDVMADLANEGITQQNIDKAEAAIAKATGQGESGR